MASRHQGQTFLEYSILIGIVVAFMVSMSPMLKRGVQGMIKVVADEVGNQVNAEQSAGIHGYLEEQYSSTQVNQVKRRREEMGEVGYIYDGSFTQTFTTTASNLGFIPGN